MEEKGIDHQSNVDLITTAGAIGRLLPKLGEFLNQEHNLQTSCMKQDIESLEIHLRRMDTALCKMPSSSQVPQPCLEDRFIQVRQLVGIHKLRAELISKVSSSNQQLKIVSIWAPGGMGKTTLAQAVYDNIKGEFSCSAFVYVGRQTDKKRALRDILIHLDKKRYSDLNTTRLDEGQLIGEIRQFLKNKRFLIIIDDIRDIPSWEVIKYALVDNGCGSRIITTSRVLGTAGLSAEVLKLMPFSIDSSKELFYATLCDCKGAVNFDPLDEQTIEYILQKCAGVPLATIMIASLLAGKSQEEWTEVYNSIGFAQEDNIGAENNTRKMIQFSYNDLPSHLKTCLLYLSIFPDGHVIEKDRLVWRWIAEGFVHDDREQEESLFKIGERYLYELVSRSMLILAVENADTNICVCGVEGMVLDWIRTVAKEENFVNASADWYDEDQYESNNARIMAIHNRVLDKPHVLTRIRSCNGTDCSISNMMFLHTTTFQVLRVLSLEGCKLTGDCSDGLKNLIAGLIHLRYLGLGGTYIRGRLKIDIGGLRYLQTLDLTDTGIGALPHGVTQLSQLKCLRCFASRRLKSPIRMGNLTSLEELWLGKVCISPNLTEELSKLTELRVLHICIRYISCGKQQEAALLVQSLSKLQKIEVLELRMGGGLQIYYLGRGGSNKEPQYHVIAPGSFPKLRYMKMDTWPVLQPGAMPQLKSVELDVHVRPLKDANFDFNDFYKSNYLRLLEKAHVRINCRKAKMEEVEEAEAALRRVLESHPNHPKLFLRRIGQCVDDDKQISGDCLQIHFSGGLHGSQLAPQVMPLELLREITNDFSEEQRLGSGTFGTVYKGVLNDKEVAVKLLHSMSQRLNYEEEFMKEFENLRRLNHPNIVQLLGYCYEIKRVCVEHEGRYVLADESHRSLCFEYMGNGSLQRHIDDKVHRLDWPTCYKIIKGTCDGLKYLHEGLETPMYHLDLKPGNILLDKNMVPKIADFGLSKLVYNNKTQDTSSFLGTKRYCPPEYIEHGYVSNKFDIFSLGVVIIEIIAGSEGYSKAYEMPSKEFIGHVQDNWRKRLKATKRRAMKCHQVKRCAEIALSCVSADRNQRPNISDITRWLKKIQKKT